MALGLHGRASVEAHSGSCSSAGNESNSLICVLPRKFGVGVYPSSQIYSSLYLVIEPLMS